MFTLRTTEPTPRERSAEAFAAARERGRVRGCRPFKGLRTTPANPIPLTYLTIAEPRERGCRIAGRGLSRDGRTSYRQVVGTRQVRISATEWDSRQFFKTLRSPRKVRGKAAVKRAKRARSMPRRARRAWDKAVSHATKAFMVARDAVLAEIAAANAAKAVGRQASVRLEGQFS